MGYDQYTVPDIVAASSLALANISQALETFFQISYL